MQSPKPFKVKISLLHHLKSIPRTWQGLRRCARKRKHCRFADFSALDCQRALCSSQYVAKMGSVKQGPKTDKQQKPQPTTQPQQNKQKPRPTHDLLARTHSHVCSVSTQFVHRPKTINGVEVSNIAICHLAGKKADDRIGLTELQPTCGRFPLPVPTIDSDNPTYIPGTASLFAKPRAFFQSTKSCGRLSGWIFIPRISLQLGLWPGFSHLLHLPASFFQE